VQKSMHVTFSFGFYSRFAKIRTSNFRRVVRKHTEGVMGSITCTAQAMDGHIMHCGTTGSCQSAANSEIVKRHRSRI